ncbi:hypothetical protein HOLleu_39614 [Holothuria leucospilota]|uniref:Integrase catalytic domain-containing protein n=1 Tax=Holothuria leucospilota TaxID=206669 RepID=A0A9Q0YIU7_HOLLE|nr:hypothetical protein HOLleu_39614 [Holothuria leucospilota]
MADEAALKLQRRTAKGKLTRTQNAVQFLLKGKRPSSEVKDSFIECKQAFEDVCKKHEEYTSVIVQDEEFDKQEKWIDECQQAFLELKIQVNDYCHDTVDLKGSDRAESAEEVSPVNPVREEAAPLVQEEVPEPEHLPIAEQSEVRSAQFSKLKMEKPKMPKFSGDVRDYHVFKSDFMHAMGTGYSKRDAISVLRACLHGKPAEMVRGIGSDFEAAWEYLDSVYGDPRFIADAIINDLNKFKVLKDGEDSRFCELVHLIRRSFNTLKEIGRPQDMDNSQMLALIERKLNGDDKKVWFRYLEMENKQATLAMLIDWLTIEMKSRMRATAPVRCDSNKSGYAVHYAGNGNTEAVKPFHKCWICETSTHWVDECKKLAAMSYSQRMEKIKDNHACFCCLKKAGKSHRMANCKRRKQCTEMINGKQCTYFHHPLLHKPQESVTGSVGITLNESAKAILPIVQTKMVGPKGREYTGNVLFDSGAEISLVRLSVAENLNLKGRHVDVTITKLGGEQEQIQTKRFQLQIKSLETDRLYQIQAIGLPTISEEIEEIQEGIDLQRLKLEHSDVKRGSGPLDLLIGVDLGQMHSGEMRQSGNLVARHSPLGWVVFGSCQGQSTYQKSVLHVKVSEPINMTDFWSTESMGVQSQNCQCEPTKFSKLGQEEGKIISESCRKVGKQWLVPYPWCKDPHLLPDNKVQVERTLQTTEKRLLKNPVYAEAYNNQIREMVDMKFAKRLSKEEQENYSGPVHYISHHAVLRPEKKSTPVRIVFNASASFQGHCLNDYWMKGPDLLNNLLGVLLRFRQYEMAACGDISKMYHRVLIPEIDQHVHRFLWRDLDIERPPDVYIKTVLTFGDKPAPAMAQTALLKTAEEGAAKYPEAAQMLKYNTYMDDICISTPSATEMTEVTNGIDKVLAEGGFSVKGWLSNCPLSVTLTEESETYWIREAQKNIVDRFENGDYKSLSPFVRDCIIRVGGRLKADFMSYETTHPVLLPQKHQVSLLITRHYHSMGHSGVACTAAKVRKKYWIIGVQRLAKSIKYKCVTCRKMDHKVETQRMANLPKERMAPYTPPFYYTSCDYFGPMTVKVGRNKTTKHYGVVFTCLNTRAVHLDLAVDCSSMEFLQVLRRFFAMRGQPAYILSDNGSQFVGAQKELQLMLKGWNQQELQEFCAGRGTEWKFTTPAAPHQNGCAESLVKSCKIALKRAIGDQVLTPMELYTCLQDIGNLVNQRPIGRVPTDPDDGHYLCPNDMLLGRALREVPQGPFRETRNPKHRVEFVQKIVNSFWQRWTRDVLPLLVPRRKWDANRRNVCVNDIVMLVDSSAVRGKWTVGRVVEVYPGNDGKVRNVKVKTMSAEYRRPIGKIAVIYPVEGYED